uniref:C-type lectin domain-containing protein n=1 Tax=Periophthalmus magnuspinnatus TaxID=409849 RepID=A0A3B3ZSL0_9GOBI
HLKRTWLVCADPDVLIRAHSFCPFISRTSGFHLFRERKTWSEAQTFCRENYVDLATIETEEEFLIVVEMIRNLNIYPWIGLYDDYTSWRWSLDRKYLYQDTNTPFGNWWSFSLSYGPNENCAEITWGILNDVDCATLKYPVCYDGEFTSKYCYIC